jgi:hypothetical protein
MCVKEHHCMSGLLQDLRFSYRELRKNPAVALTAVLSITLGIGATTAVFSVIYGLLVNPFPYQGADRMIYLEVVNQNGEPDEVEFTGAQLKVLRRRNASRAWPQAGEPGISPPPAKISRKMSRPCT